jgi:two-component system chemotaxis sensor kinase CheA
MSEKDNFSEMMHEESAELLNEMEEALLELEKTPDDISLVNRIFRAVHTLKGAANMFGFEDVAILTHELETVFERVRSGRRGVTTALLDLALRSKDVIWALLQTPEELDRSAYQDLLNGMRFLNASAEEHSSPAQPEPEQPPACQERVDDIFPEPVSSEEEEQGALPAGYHAIFKPLGANLATHADPLLILEELRALDIRSLVPHAEDLPLLASLQPDSLALWWELLIAVKPGEATLERIKDAFIFVEDPNAIQISPVDDLDDWILRNAPFALPDLIKPEGREDEQDELDTLWSATPPSIPIVQPCVPTPAPSVAARERESQPQVEPAFAPRTATSEDPAESQNAPAAQVAAKSRKEAVAPSIRVDAYKLDDMVALVGELVIAQARLAQVVAAIKDTTLHNVSEELERLCGGLRDRTLSMRMLPIGATFDRFRRLVRDLAHELGKDVEFITQGAETELDKTVIEQLGDPLVHLLRNALDHGIESPSERESAGKSPKGSIVLSAEHSGGNVLIRIFDNGRGLDRDRIAAKGVERGLITDPDSLTNKEVFSLIFHPGFSTAEKITNISGRGVGMDVVKKSIEALRGVVELDSQKGVGATVTVKLPLTLAIIEGLQVRVGEEFFVIPLTSVHECVELRAERGCEETSCKRIINLRNEIVPFVRLREWFDVPGAKPEIEQIIIAGDENNRTGIVVDEVIGQQQTVIKSLGKVFKGLDEISGATIKGDGGMALILDIPFLVRKVKALAAQGE